MYCFYALHFNVLGTNRGSAEFMHYTPEDQLAYLHIKNETKSGKSHSEQKQAVVHSVMIEKGKSNEVKACLVVWVILQSCSQLQQLHDKNLVIITIFTKRMAPPH